MPLSKFLARFRGWVARHIVAEDPSPEYSRLDSMCLLPRAGQSQDGQPAAGAPERAGESAAPEQQAGEGRAR